MLSNYMTSQTSFFGRLSILCTFALCILSLQGWYRVPQTMLMALFVVWTCITFLGFPKEIGESLKKKRFIALYIFCIFRYLILLFNYSVVVSFNNILMLLYRLSPIILYEVLKNRNRKIRGLFILAIFITILSNIVTSYSYMSFVSADTMRNAREYGEEFFIVTVAFGLCSLLSILTPAVFEVGRRALIQKKLKKWQMVVYIGLLVVFFAYLLRAQYSTALFLAILGVLFSISYNKKRIISFIVASFLFAVVSIKALPYIIESMETSEQYTQVTVRLNEVYDTLTGNEQNATDFNSRRNKSVMSLETFFENPIVGVGYKLDKDVHVKHQGIGNHAAWPDALAEFGLFALFLFYFLYDSLKRQSKTMDSALTIFLFIALGFLNPILYFPQIFAAFLFVPMIYQFFLLDDEVQKPTIV